MSYEGGNNTLTNVTTSTTSTDPSALTSPTTNTSRGSRRGGRNRNDRNSSNSGNNNAKTRTSGLISLKDFKGLTPEIEAVLCLPTETCPNKESLEALRKTLSTYIGAKIENENDLVPLFRDDKDPEAELITNRFPTLDILEDLPEDPPPTEKEKKQYVA